MNLVCERYVSGFTEYTQLMNLEAVAAERGYDPRALLKHLSLSLSTGVVHEGGRWLVKGARSQATLQTLVSAYVPMCHDCTRPATHGTPHLAVPTHCRYHREAAMTLLS